MYLGECAIDQYLTFAVCTKQPAAYDAGGGAVDADSPPAYRIYEEETATPILTGTMAKLDDANTLGFYSERIQLTAASGFEYGKFYNIYISYEVSSVVVAEMRTLQMKESGGSVDPQINYIYDRIGMPVALDGGDPTVSSMLTKMADDNGGVDFNSEYGSLQSQGMTLSYAYGRIGIPLDLGDGYTLADNMSSIAGKTAGASSYVRSQDSLEAISDSASGLSIADMKNLLFKRNVTARHALNDKPRIITVGDGATLATVTTTLDGVAVEQIKTEDWV